MIDANVDSSLALVLPPAVRIDLEIVLEEVIEFLEDDSPERDARRYRFLKKALSVNADLFRFVAVGEKGPGLQPSVERSPIVRSGAGPSWYYSLDAAIDAWIEQHEEPDA